MYKYIFFVVLGIIIYLLSNRNNNFSVGGQIYQRIEQLESMARLVAMGKEDPTSQRLCAISGVGRCQLEQREAGGSCSINALAGLVYTSASFTTEYQEYLNRFGREIRFVDQQLNVYRCIMNMPNMVATLVSNNLNPRRTEFVNSENKLLDLNRDLSIQYNRLYMIVYILDYSNITINLENHSFLIYRITKRKLGRLLEFMNENKILYDDDNPNNGSMKYNEILQRLTTLYEDMDGSFGLLIIDFCNNIFDIITDQSFPITTPAERFAQVYVEDYNNKWKLKIFWFWMDIFNGSMSFMDEDGTKNVDSRSSIVDKELANRYLLENIDNLVLSIFNTYSLEEDEELKIDECFKPIEYELNLSPCSVIKPK